MDSDLQISTSFTSDTSGIKPSQDALAAMQTSVAVANKEAAATNAVGVKEDIALTEKSILGKHELRAALTLLSREANQFSGIARMMYSPWTAAIAGVMVGLRELKKINAEIKADAESFSSAQANIAAWAANLKEALDPLSVAVANLTAGMEAIKSAGAQAKSDIDIAAKAQIAAGADKAEIERHKQEDQVAALRKEQASVTKARDAADAILKEQASAQAQRDYAQRHREMDKEVKEATEEYNSKMEQNAWARRLGITPGPKNQQMEIEAGKTFSAVKAAAHRLEEEDKARIELAAESKRLDKEREALGAQAAAIEHAMAQEPKAQAGAQAAAWQGGVPGLIAAAGSGDKAAADLLRKILGQDQFTYKQINDVLETLANHHESWGNEMIFIKRRLEDLYVKIDANLGPQ